MLERWAWNRRCRLGNGVAYEGGELIGFAKMTQLLSVFKAGGQVYSEVVFFERQKSILIDSGKLNRNVSLRYCRFAAASGLPYAKYVGWSGMYLSDERVELMV